MNHKKTELYFLLILLAGIFILTFFIFRPFLYALVLAMVIATVFGPVHKRIFVLTREKEVPAALLSTVLVLVIVVVPIVFVGIQIFREATQLYSFLAQNGEAIDFSRGLGGATSSLERFLPVPLDFSVDFSQYARQGLNWLLLHLGPLFTNAARMIVSAFVFLAALYYLFKDGQKLKRAVIAYSPLRDIHDETIFSKLALAVNSVVKGNLAVALTQGTLTAVGFYIFGVPNATLWGSVAAIAALIPGVGTALVIVPAVLFLFLSGETFFAVGLVLWGITAVGLVDNFLGPKLVGQGTRLHPFLILLSILGGIGLFGPLGFLLGPIALCLLFALLDIYRTISQEQERL